MSDVAAYRVFVCALFPVLAIANPHTALTLSIRKWKVALMEVSWICFYISSTILMFDQLTSTEWFYGYWIVYVQCHALQ